MKMKVNDLRKKEYEGTKNRGEHIEEVMKYK